MQLTVEQQGDIALVEIHGDRLDAGNAEDFKAQMEPTLLDFQKVILNLQGVQFVDSSGCGAILLCLKRLQSNNGELKICGIGQYVRTVFELIRLHRICDILPECADAIRAFQKPA